jgi:hypothetical protein
MTRTKCGLLLLLAAGLGACGGDPTDSFREEGQKIVTDPAVAFVNEGASVFVVAQLQDNQGNQLATDFQATALGPELTVTRDTAFLETTNGQQLKTRERFIVTGVTPGATSFELTGGSLKDTVRVNVTPTSLPAVFSNAAPAANELVTLTAPNYNFLPGTTVVIGADSAIVFSVGSELKFLPVPGSTGAVTVNGAAISFLPETPLTLTSTDSITVGAIGALGGTDAPATAPALPVPAAGETAGLYDAPDFTASADHFYKLDVTEDGDYTITMNWTVGSDLDLILCNDAACSAPDFTAATGNHPESATFTLTAGTYYLVSEDFGGDAAGTRLTWTISR